MTFKLGWLLSTFLALGTTSAGVSAARLAVEYNFNNATHPVENTGKGISSTSLDGSLYRRNSITFDGNGTDGTIAARFNGEGCIQIPDSDDVNTDLVRNREISLDFNWDGTRSSQDPQVLYEQGGRHHGMNIYLQNYADSHAALAMAVWKTTNGASTVNKKSIIHSGLGTIAANTWYHVTLMLNAESETTGTFTGYLQDVLFGREPIGFLPIPPDNSPQRGIATCVGGARESTMTFFPDVIYQYQKQADQLGFRGQIDNFELRDPKPAVKSIVAVEYKFNGNASRYKNTGIGDPTLSLDGYPYPSNGHGIGFRNRGHDGTAAAKFKGKGCIHIPDSVEVNLGPLGGRRMISLDFKWDGEGEDNTRMILYLEGGTERGGYHIFLKKTGTSKARLFMAVWDRKSGNEWNAEVVHTSKKKIEMDTWYHVTMLLDEASGTLSGYLDDDKFGEKDVDFFPIKERRGQSCVGGRARTKALIFEAGNKDPTEYARNGNGLFFNGLIDNFRIRTEKKPLEPKPVVEYFIDSNPFKNTGDGGSRLDAQVYEVSKKYIVKNCFGGDCDNDYLIENWGMNFGHTAGTGIDNFGLGVSFAGRGWVELPDSNEVNGRSVSHRTISLDFKWSGSHYSRNPQILFGEGGSNNGINIYLTPNNGTSAQLVMAVWKDLKLDESATIYANSTLAFVETTIISDTWYYATLVLNRFQQSVNGGLTGYLDGLQFGNVEIDFFPIPKHGQGFIGGMNKRTRTILDVGTEINDEQEFPLFIGSIGSFRLYNSVERPAIPMASPPGPSPTIAPTASMFPTTTMFPTTGALLVLEYMFNNNTFHTENTGFGNPSPSDRLDGILYPEDMGNGITFTDGNGPDNSVAAKFTGKGCIHIPQSHDINGGVGDRTISLDFSWDASNSTAQILFEEGGRQNGISMHLRPLAWGTAKLVMAMWETNDDILEAVAISKTVNAHTWYQASLVLDQYDSSNEGVLMGYLNGEKFSQKTVTFLPMNLHMSNSIGGMKSGTMIIDSGGAATAGYFYFHGLIDNFRLFNSVEVPAPMLMPTPVPSLSVMPSRTPSSLPSSSPFPSSSPTTTSLPSDFPSAQPSTPPTSVPYLSIMPTNTPLSLPSSSPFPSSSPTTTSLPSDFPSAQPSTPPTSVPSLSIMPTSTPSSLPSSSPSRAPSSLPSSSPSHAPSSLPSSIPTMTPSELPSMLPSEPPSTTTVPTMAPILVVEYMFNNHSLHTENTGFGNPFPSDSLDGILFPANNNDIEFDYGRGADVTAKFTGHGCIEIPLSDDINGPIVDRTISLEFLWDGTNLTEPQFLFEEGGGGVGVNIFLHPDTRQLIMAAWETNGGKKQVAFVVTTINANTWYQASLVLDRSGSSLAGYLNGMQFGVTPVDFFEINSHSNHNCLGGVNERTLIIFSNGGYEARTSSGLYFHGLIDNFRLFNSVELPAAVPSTMPTELLSPTADPTQFPSPPLSLFPSILPSADLPPLPTPLLSTIPSSILIEAQEVDNSLTPLPSDSPSAAPTQYVKYTFDNPLDRMKNSGMGQNLDGRPFPRDYTINGITFPPEANGNDAAIASFVGMGCIQIATEGAINSHINDRTISLSFLWNGTPTNASQTLVELGGGDRRSMDQGSGLNIHLDTYEGNEARLIMSVFSTAQGGPTETAVVSTSGIIANTWHVATMVIDQFSVTGIGKLQGYLDGVMFGTAHIDFFPIGRHHSGNCLGGMRGGTIIVDRESGDATRELSNGLYFYGEIDNFMLYNTVQHPPTSLPSISPTLSAMPTTSAMPTAAPSKSNAPSESALPSNAPSESSAPSKSSIPSAQPSLPPRPANDLCIDAATVEIDSTTFGSTINATVPNGLVDFFCFGDKSVDSRAVWYNLTGNGNRLLLSTCNTANFDTELAVFNSGCMESGMDGALGCQAHNSNSDGCGATSELEFDSYNGVQYVILVYGSSSGQFGTFNLTVSDTGIALPPTPMNNLCMNATEVEIGSTTFGSTIGATVPYGIAGTTCGGYSIRSRAVWYTLMGNGNPLLVSTCNAADYNTQLSVYSGGCIESRADGALGCVGGNDDYGDCRLQSKFVFKSESGVRYLIMMHGLNYADFGNFNLTVIDTVIATPPTPMNNLCVNATEVEIGSITSGSTANATVPYGIARTMCGEDVGEVESPAVWYTLRGNGNYLTLSTCNEADFDTQISVYMGECMDSSMDGAVGCIGGNDDATGCSGGTSQFDFYSYIGVEYHILVHGRQEQFGNFNLTVNDTGLSSPSTPSPTASALPTKVPSQSQVPSQSWSPSQSQVPSQSWAPSQSHAPSQSGSPSQSPTLLKTTLGSWTNITFDDFESVSGGETLVSGGRYAKRYNDEQWGFTYQGHWAVQLRGNRGIESSFYHGTDQNLTGCSNVRVHFWYRPHSMEEDHDDAFVVEYSSNSGTNWTIVKTFVSGQDFVGATNVGSFLEATVDFSDAATKNITYTTDHARIRFRSEGNSFRDYVFIDNVLFQCFEPLKRGG